MEKRHILYDVSYIVMLLVRFLEAQTMVEYNSPAHGGKPDYALHDLYKDGVHINDSPFIHFQVKCEGNAFVLLHQHRKNFTNCAVEIQIGVANNSRFGVWILGETKKLYMHCPARNIVSKSEYRHFWISWAEHVINIGSGSTPMTQENKCSENITFDINYISIGSAYNTAAYWKFEKSQLTRSPTGKTQTVSTSQNIKPSNATPQSTHSPTSGTQSLSTSQNVNPSNEKSQSTPLPTGRTQTMSTSDNIKPSNGDTDTGTGIDYIIVPVVVILSVLISAIVLLVYKEKRIRRMKQTELDVEFNVNSSHSANASEGPGIEETQIFNTQALDTPHDTLATTSSNDTETHQVHSSQIILEGKEPQGATPNHFESVNVDKEVKTEDEYTKSHPVPKAETYHDVYSHVSHKPCQNKSMLDKEKTDQIEHNTTNANGHSDTFNEGEEDQSSVYDHAITRNICTRRGDVSEYSQLKDIN